MLGNAAKTAGNCIVDDHAILGSGVIVKHGCRVGSWALVKDGCRANKDVPPYIVAAHNPIAYYGVNAFILRKEQKLSEEIIDDIAKAYRQVYQWHQRRKRPRPHPRNDRHRSGGTIHPHVYRAVHERADRDDDVRHTFG